MFSPLILYPFGGNAKEALTVIQDINKIKKSWKVLGFIDDDSSQWGREFLGIKVLGDKKLLKNFPEAKILAVPGNPKNYLKRHQIIKSLDVPASRFAKIIHPTVVASSDIKVGCNTLIMAHVVLGCDVSIGNHCIILPNTTISHNTVLDNYVCVGSNVSVAGSVTINRNCYIGSGTNIREGISVGENSLIGLGSVVVKDIKKRTVAVGNPARILRRN